MITTWIDSSFVIEWLIGSEKSRSAKAFVENGCTILDNQYCEVVTFFLRKGVELREITKNLESLLLEHPQKSDLTNAASMYNMARGKGSKASLSDCILAAAVARTKGRLLNFDSDFSYLGLVTQKEGVWEIGVD